MSPRSALHAAAAALATVVACAAQAQSAPPIKPGLWSYEMSTGNPAEDAQRAEAMKGLQNMPPAQRAQIEAMMKQRGISMQGNNIKVCQSKESLESGRWAESGGKNGCKTDFSQRSAGAWKWHTSCPDAETDGIATFASADSYTVEATTTLKGAAPRRTLVKASYLGSNCGDLKPMTPPAR